MNRLVSVKLTFINTYILQIFLMQNCYLKNQSSIFLRGKALQLPDCFNYVVGYRHVFFFC